MTNIPLDIRCLPDETDATCGICNRDLIVPSGPTLALLLRDRVVCNDCAIDHDPLLAAVCIFGRHAVSNALPPLERAPQPDYHRIAARFSQSPDPQSRLSSLAHRLAADDGQCRCAMRSNARISADDIQIQIRQRTKPQPSPDVRTNFSVRDVRGHFGLENGRWYLAPIESTHYLVLRAFRFQNDVPWQLNVDGCGSIKGELLNPMYRGAQVDVQSNGRIDPNDWYVPFGDHPSFGSDPLHVWDGDSILPSLKSVGGLITGDHLARAVFYDIYGDTAICARCLAPRGNPHHRRCHTPENVPLFPHLDPETWRCAIDDVSFDEIVGLDDSTDGQADAEIETPQPQ